SRKGGIRGPSGRGARPSCSFDLLVPPLGGLRCRLLLSSVAAVAVVAAVDGGRSATAGPRRWPLCRHVVGVLCRRIDHRLAVSVNGGRCATAGPRRWSMRHRRSQTTVDAPPQVPDDGRCATAGPRRGPLYRHVFGVM